MVVTGRRIRLTAVLVGVVLALTGFSSTGGHGSGGKSKSGGGGGCSSSKSKSKKKSSSYGSTSGGSSSGSGGSAASPTPTSTRPPAHAEVVTCAGPGLPKATVKVTSDSAAAAYTFRVPLVFEGAAGQVDTGSVDLVLKAGESRTVDLPMASPDKASTVVRCTVGRVTAVSAASPGPTSGSSSGSDSGSVSGSTGGKTTTKPTSKPKSTSTRKTR